ncbi:hypothetical protein MA16_Dca003819 [Dendrobium catenatum]|uniref:Uncharacterized protein n=1 Tax=Dendrobium catenatum TaxID=906689 RepID=A0A2I0X1M0_9ASPA|nr:hypothetical protein MA16_Dca003819 [Dendrobium catenatum]
MAGVIHKFLFASIAMWIAPIVILYGFNHHIFPGWFPWLSKLDNIMFALFPSLSVY